MITETSSDRYRLEGGNIRDTRDNSIIAVCGCTSCAEKIWGLLTADDRSGTIGDRRKPFDS